MANSIFRFTAVLLFLLWQSYWVLMAKRSRKVKPEQKSSSKRELYESLITRSLKVVIFLQLIGVSILPINPRFSIQPIGLLLIGIGITVSMLARKELDTNWTRGQEYQIKKQQSLVTRGIYQYIRHPIYSGMLIAIIGAELVAQSYLVIPFSILLFSLAYYAGKREEQLLQHYFGKDYQRYMKRSAMLIPFIL